MNRKVIIEPLTRVEGHGKVTIHLDDNGEVVQSRLHIVEFRGFERFVCGRPYWEAPVLVQRLCGICPVSHHLAAAKAMDVIVGAGTGKGLTVTSEKIRRLMHYGQIFQSHALHFFHLASPDLLFGYDALSEKRNVINIAVINPDLARQAIMMRKYGQEIILATAGKKIHGTGAVPGGVNKSLLPEERENLLNGKSPLNADEMVELSLSSIEFFKDYYRKNRSFIDDFSRFDSNYLSLVGHDGGMDLYHGVLRAVDSEGRKILNDVDCQDYSRYLREDVRSWSYMKFPYLVQLGKENGWYRVGPLARLNTVDYIPTPLAQREFEEYKLNTGGKPNNMCMHTHWARLIELLHAAEVIRNILKDDDIIKNDLVIQEKGERQSRGVGVIEAPRGTLFHDYEVNADDQITRCNLIVSTTNNNEPMNRGINYVAKAIMTGKKVITESMMNAVEVVIRAYDPCLSCATHSYGDMPLEVSLFDAAGNLIEMKRK